MSTNARLKAKKPDKPLYVPRYKRTKTPNGIEPALDVDENCSTEPSVPEQIKAHCHLSLTVPEAEAVGSETLGQSEIVYETINQPITPFEATVPETLSRTSEHIGDSGSRELMRDCLISDVDSLKDANEFICKKLKGYYVPPHRRGLNESKSDERRNLSFENETETADQLDSRFTQGCSRDNVTCDGESWDARFDDCGNSLDDSIIQEICLSVGDVKFERPQFDYSHFNFRPRTEINADSTGYSHIVELYDFPKELKTEDLCIIFSSFKSQGFEIRWVDDTHALVIFSSQIAATDALNVSHSLVKIRPLTEASTQSKSKAQRIGLENSLPRKPRPETTAVLARRLVIGALGLQVKPNRQRDEQERQKLKEASARKKTLAAQTRDVWDTPSSSERT